MTRRAEPYWKAAKELADYRACTAKSADGQQNLELLVSAQYPTYVYYRPQIGSSVHWQVNITVPVTVWHGHAAGGAQRVSEIPHAIDFYWPDTQPAELEHLVAYFKAYNARHFAISVMPFVDSQGKWYACTTRACGAFLP